MAQEPGGGEVQIISEHQTIADQSKVGGLRRKLSQVAENAGFTGVAKKLNPDIEIKFEEPVHPDDIIITDTNENSLEQEEPQTTEEAKITPEQTSVVDEPVDTLVSEPQPNQLIEEDSDLNISEVKNEAARVQKEIPENTKIVGQVDDRDQFERVIVENAIMEQMTSYMRATNSERGGILVGQFCVDSNGQEFTTIQDFVPNESGASSWGSIKFTDQDWTAMLAKNDEMNRQRSENLVVVGWVHSHPPMSAVAPQSQGDEGYGDRFIIKNYFADKRFVSMIYGNGGSYDNQYSIWRADETKLKLQKGFELNSPKADSNYGYYSAISEIDL